MFIITGGGSGIGKALALELAKRGKQVLIIGRHESTLEKTAGFSSLISTLCADVSTDEGRKKIQSQIKNQPKLEALVHNAGIIEPIAALAAVDEAGWRQIIETNLNAPFLLSQALLAQLKGGRVLHIGSGAAYQTISACAAYCVSKAALSMLTRCWQLETKEVAFASVMPGIIDTHMQTAMRQAEAMEKQQQQFYKDLQQEQGLIQPETVAAFLAWLLLEVDKQTYSSQEWDIYDTSHHSAWLVYPQTVPRI